MEIEIERAKAGVAEGDVSVPAAQVRLDKWSEAKFHDNLQNNIDRSCWARPRKIQSKAIPLIAEGYFFCFIYL